MLYSIHSPAIISLYYRRDYKRLPVCTLPIHSLLHVADDIRYHGPVCIHWTWVMERYCGILGTVTASTGWLNSNATLSTCMLHHAQLTQVQLRYNIKLPSNRKVIPDGDIHSGEYEIIGSTYFIYHIILVMF